MEKPATTRPRARPTVGSKAWRRERLASLLGDAALHDQASGLPLRGASRRMADRLGLAPTALSNMARGAKSIGDAAARAIETKLGLAPGALDAPPLSILCKDEAELQALRRAQEELRK